MIYDRLFLGSLIVGVWALIKLTEEMLPDKALNYLPKPLALYAVLVFVVAMIIHTIWLALAQRRKGFFKTRFENSTNQIPKISRYPSVDIFIAVHNEEKVIAATIENLLCLNYPDYLIYLINDRSTDSTKEILERYHLLYPNTIKVIHRLDESSSGKAAALNNAFRHSSGELITVFDADAKVESDFLLTMVPYLVDDQTSAVQSQKRVSNANVNYLTKLQENEYCLDNYFQCGKDVIEGNVELRGNGQIIKRKVLESVGLWDEETLTDDLELSTRLTVSGWQIRFCPEAITLEQAPINFSSLIIQRRRWTEGSLRRFLSNFLKIFGPGKETRFSQQFDAFVFLSQFAVPIWIFLDIISEIVRYLKDQETHLTSLMLISFVIWLITLVNLIFGIRIYRNFSWRTSIKRALETNIYFLTIWPLIVLLTVRKVLFSRTKGRWHRTEHYNDTELKKV
ncbi:MAG: glycosyltransferase family 2 protein [Candidatus Melainabacteria bacterium]|nr:glycosyltransferase family 2 protein [Candidatus Melainabacteria bacterium]